MTNLTLTKTWTNAYRYDPLKEDMSSLSHIRVYAYSPGVVAVQIRSETKSRKRKTWNIISSANLNLEAARAVKAALDTWILEQEPRVPGQRPAGPPAVHRHEEDIMTITRGYGSPHWRVDHVTEERRPNIPLAWFLRRWQAEEYIQTFAGDRLNPSFSHVLVDETPRDPDDLEHLEQ